jgi:osmotically-inducible protein OsmY
MLDEHLRRDVAAQLSWDPRIDTAAITVSVQGGVVTLHGTVASCRARREADQAAKRVSGVTRVDTKLVVRPDIGPCDDTELSGDVMNALMLNVLIPMTVTARARDGLVTLTGTVRWQHERDEAELCAGGVPGVADIVNHISLTSAAAGPGTTDAIMSALRRSAILGDCDVSVEMFPDGTVILAGTVPCWAAHAEAIATAWAAPGVTEVQDKLVFRRPGWRAS